MTFSSAMSLIESAPTKVALRTVSSYRVTVALSAPFMTCVFVTIRPSAVSTKPVPQL